MKIKTLSKEALAKMNLSSKAEDNQDSVETPEETLEETQETQTPEVQDTPEVDESLSEVEELKETLSSLESENTELKTKLEGFESELETLNEKLSNSEELVTNLSENLRAVVNSMKVAMGHVELSDEVVGEALLKEYNHTTEKFMKSMPAGSVTESKETVKPSLKRDLASQTDYNNMPWS